MKFLTAEEARNRLAHTLGDDGWPVISVSKCPIRHEAFKEAPGYTYLAKARQIVGALGHFQWCLLWVSLTDVWPSNENLHLYYRVRECTAIATKCRVGLRWLQCNTKRSILSRLFTWA